jgi:hypothetical protein
MDVYVVLEYVQGGSGVHQVYVEVHEEVHELGSLCCEDRGAEDAWVGGVGDYLCEAEAMTALVSVHPKFTQEPPRSLRSASATDIPSAASL